jgi:hypothetical protein
MVKRGITMSMNIYITAVREIYIPNIDKFSIQQITFDDVWQTPTDITRKILAHPDLPTQLDEYRSWVRSRGTIRHFPIYHENDHFSEGPILRFEEFDEAEHQIQQLNTWIDFCQQEGYSIQLQEI